jgi:hypothetical protein
VRGSAPRSGGVSVTQPVTVRSLESAVRPETWVTRRSLHIVPDTWVTLPGFFAEPSIIYEPLARNAAATSNVFSRKW